MSFNTIRHRLRHGRPLVVDADTCAAFRARGVALDTPGSVGLLLRKRPDDVLAHYRAEVQSRVDLLSALTADTTPRALAEVGMEHRSAALTGLAVELALEAAAANPKPVGVAGVLGSDMVSSIAVDRQREELTEHAHRIAAAGVELIIARGQGSRLDLMAAVVAAAETELPTWAVVECLPGGELVAGGDLASLVQSLEQAGASAVLLEVPSVDEGLEQLCHLGAVSGDSVPGVLLAGGRGSVRGFPDPESDATHWAQGALELDARGARVIGGGAGTTEAHTATLAQALGSLHPSIPAPRSA